MLQKMLMGKWEATEQVLFSLKKELELDGYEVDLRKLGDQFIVKISDANGGFGAMVRDLVGLSAATTLTATKINEKDVRVKVFGRWWDKTTAFFASFFLSSLCVECFIFGIFGWLFITSIVGAFRQNKLTTLVYTSVSNSLLNAKIEPARRGFFGRRVA